MPVKKVAVYQVPRLDPKQLQNLMFEQFSVSWDALEKEENKLIEECNIARNLAAGNWEHTVVPSSLGGHVALCPVRYNPELLEILNKNKNILLEELSKRRYALIAAYMPFLEKTKRKLTRRMLDCYNYWSELVDQETEEEKGEKT